jgi:hypothetical protein
MPLELQQLDAGFVPFLRAERAAHLPAAAARMDCFPCLLAPSQVVLAALRALCRDDAVLERDIAACYTGAGGAVASFDTVHMIRCLYLYLYREKPSPLRDHGACSDRTSAALRRLHADLRLIDAEYRFHARAALITCHRHRQMAELERRKGWSGSVCTKHVLYAIQVENVRAYERFLLGWLGAPAQPPSCCRMERCCPGTVDAAFSSDSAAWLRMMRDWSDAKRGVVRQWIKDDLVYSRIVSASAESSLFRTFVWLTSCDDASASLAPQTADEHLDVMHHYATLLATLERDHLHHGDCTRLPAEHGAAVKEPEHALEVLVRQQILDTRPPHPLEQQQQQQQQQKKKPVHVHRFALAYPLLIE